MDITFFERNLSSHHSRIFIRTVFILDGIMVVVGHLCHPFWTSFVLGYVVVEVVFSLELIYWILGVIAFCRLRPRRGSQSLTLNIVACFCECLLPFSFFLQIVSDLFLQQVSSQTPVFLWHVDVMNNDCKLSLPDAYLPGCFVRDVSRTMVSPGSYICFELCSQCLNIVSGIAFGAFQVFEILQKLGS